MPTPAESPREVTLRSRVIWSFWTAILLLGFPTWWATTSIYRASLPTESMLEKHTDLWYTIPVCFQSRSIPLADLSRLAKETQQQAKGSQGLFKFDIEAKEQCASDHVSTVFSFEPGHEPDISYSAQYSLFKVPLPENNQQGYVARLSAYLESLFLEEHASIAYQLFTNERNNDQIQEFVRSLPQDLVASIQKSANRAFKPSSNYHLTFSLFTAGASPSSWDVQRALDRYIQPILFAISATSQVSVTSQIQLYSSFSSSVQPQQTESGWRLRREDLTSFVNTAEWPLSPSVGSGPTINFIAYVPDPKHIPLLLDDGSENSWLVPHWGGIGILNPPLNEVEGSELGAQKLPVHLDFDSLIPAFNNFRLQFLQLLGVPESAQLPLPERLKSFRRLSALSLYIRTSSNLGSLARLAQHLSSIPIPRHVLHHVEFSLSQLSSFRSCLTSGSGGTWSTCLQSVKSAFADSEKAFFDKSMVGQVYFPDEHKVAVYLPLLGPIGVPLVIGLIRELKSLKTRKLS